MEEYVLDPTQARNYQLYYGYQYNCKTDCLIILMYIMLLALETWDRS